MAAPQHSRNENGEGGKKVRKKVRVIDDFTTDPRAFPRGDEFIPERWTTQPELVRDPAVNVPFSVGKMPSSYTRSGFFLEVKITQVARMLTFQAVSRAWGNNSA